MVENLTVKFILGTSCIDRFVKVILPGKKKVLFYEVSAVGIISSTEKDNLLEGNSPTLSIKLRVAKPEEFRQGPEQLY